MTVGQTRCCVPCYCCSTVSVWYGCSNCNLDCGGSYSFSFEAKIGGATGYNIELDMTAPSISGSSTKTLVRAQSGWSGSLPIGGGLSLKYGFDGLAATVSGTGSATGSAKMTSSLAASASLGVYYTRGNLNYIETSKFEYKPAKLDNSGLTPNSNMNIRVDLTGSEKLQISYAGYIGADFSISLTGSLEFDFVGPRGSSRRRLSEVSVDLGPVRASAASLPSYLPGDAVPVNVNYAGLNPDETTMLFYSIVCPGGFEYSVKQTSFTSSPTGEGVFSAEWIVPWDSHYTADGKQAFHLSIRLSSGLGKIYTSPQFTLAMFTETDGAVTHPKAGEVVPVDVPYALRWNPASIFYFKKRPLTLFQGEKTAAKHVRINLVRELLFPNGSLHSSQIFRNITDTNSVPNTGVADVTFIANFTRGEGATDELLRDD